MYENIKASVARDGVRALIIYITWALVHARELFCTNANAAYVYIVWLVCFRPICGFGARRTVCVCMRCRGRRYRFAFCFPPGTESPSLITLSLAPSPAGCWPAGNPAAHSWCGLRRACHSLHSLIDCPLMASWRRSNESGSLLLI